MAQEIKKIQTTFYLTPKQKELLDELVSASAKNKSEIVGQLIENYQESYKRKYC